MHVVALGGPEQLRDLPFGFRQCAAESVDIHGKDLSLTMWTHEATRLRQAWDTYGRAVWKPRLSLPGPSGCTFNMATWDWRTLYGGNYYIFAITLCHNLIQVSTHTDTGCPSKSQAKSGIWAGREALAR